MSVVMVLLLAACSCVLVLPGFIVTRSAGENWAYAAAVSVPVTFGLIGVLGYLFGLIHLPFTVLTVTLAVGLIAAGCLGWRRWRNHPQPGWRPVLAGWPQVLLIILAVTTSVSFAVRGQLNGVLRSADGLRTIPQGWDSLWHTSTIRFIADEHIASSVRMGELRNIETGDPLFYPSGYHAVAALTYRIARSLELLGLPAGAEPSITPVMTYNTVSPLIMAVCFALSAAALAWRLTRDRRSPEQAAVAAVIAGGLAAAWPALPYIEVAVGAVPNGIAIALAPAAAVVVMSAAAHPRRILLAGLSASGVCVIHPTGFIVLLLLLISWWLLWRLWVPVTSRLKEIATLAATGIVAVAIVAPLLLATSEVAEEVASFSFTHATAATQDAFRQAILLQTRHLDAHGVQYVLLGLALLGGLVLLWRRQIWPVLLWAVVILVTANSVSPFAAPYADWVTPLGTVFYNDPRRLSVVTTVLLAGVVGTGSAAVLAAVGFWPKRPRSTAAVAPAATTAPPELPAHLRIPAPQVQLPPLPGQVGPAEVRAAAPQPTHSPDNTDSTRPHPVLVTAMTALSLGASVVWSFTPSQLNGVGEGGAPLLHARMMAAADHRAMQWMTTLPGIHEGHILTNPWDGGVWMYPAYGLPSLHRHYLEPYAQPQGWTFVTQGNLLGVDPAVNAAVEDLELKYIYLSPQNYWEGSFQFAGPAYTLMDANPNLQLLYEEWPVRVYGIRSQLTAEELAVAQETSPAPPESAPYAAN